jgi:hypothetical protein
MVTADGTEWVDALVLAHVLRLESLKAGFRQASSVRTKALMCVLL